MQVSKWLAAGSFALLAFGPQWASATGYPNAPVTTVVSVPFILTINAENPRVAGVVDVKSLVDLARRNPNTVSYGSAGNGNLMHLAGSPAGDHVRYADAACPVPGRGADGGGVDVQGGGFRPRHLVGRAADQGRQAEGACRVHGAALA
ncbi:hypothetical protein DY367_05190 [Achromobacter xylosoxidans]|uniref:Uncharacterized protein n=1 Tax=Alcaligenes xylosoxydans xylosoxydans TaxID=85698 RepID=A0A424WHZ4_ALCXX|nr:hypothetical protein [Achromobacter xylosoxidans]RPJ92890.1 hypothetical protein DY367_05190 [Achromobacter xylosoxidans]